MGGVVNSVSYLKGRRVADIQIEEIGAALREPGLFIWIGLHEPEEELLRRVQHEFGLHDLAIEDAHRAHQRPKFERYDDSLFIVLRTAQIKAEPRHIEFGETHLFVGARYVVSVRHGSSLTYTEVRKRSENSPQLLEKGPGFVVHALMDFVVDQYFPIVEVLEDELEALEDDVFAERAKRDTTERIYTLKRDLVEVKRAISPLVDICNRLLRLEDELIAEDTRPYFRDVHDHVIRINEMIDGLRELTTSVLEANLALISVRQNDAMKLLTGWAAIIAVPTMIAGIYGMNFRFMPELDWAWGYPLVMGLMLGACGFLYFRFKRSGWL